jgi:hypothetical protein
MLNNVDLLLDHGFILERNMNQFITFNIGMTEDEQEYCLQNNERKEGYCAYVIYPNAFNTNLLYFYRHKLSGDVEP